MYSINLNKLKSLASQSKYTNWYISIVVNAINRFKVDPNVKIEQNRRMAQKLLGKIDGHHIIPRSVDPSLADDIFNIVFLTKREHIIMHQLLTKMLSGDNKDKMLFAYRRIVRRNKVTLNSKQAANLCAEIKPANLGKVSITNGFETKYVNTDAILPVGWRRGYGSNYLIRRQSINDATHRKYYKIKNVITNQETIVKNLAEWAKDQNIPYTSATSASRGNYLLRRQYVISKMN